MQSSGWSNDHKIGMNMQLITIEVDDYCIWFPFTWESVPKIVSQLKYVHLLILNKYITKAV